MAVLVVAEYRAGRLSPATAQCLYEVHKNGQPIDLLLMGRDCTHIALPKTVLETVRTLLVAEAGHLDGLLPEEAAPAIRELVISGLSAGYGMVVAAHSNVIAPVMARLSALLDVCPLLGVTRMAEDGIYDCPVYGGAILQTVQSSAPVQVITLALPPSGHDDSNHGEDFISFENRGDCHAAVKEVALPKAVGLTRIVETVAPSGQDSGLDTARFVVGCGGGVESREQLAGIEKLADRLGAVTGGSKVAVDNGLLPARKLIGQSGKTIAPDIYLALGISGSMHHLSAVLDATVIISVNRDSEAPIFSFADYSLVGDIGEMVRELEKELDRQG